MQNVNPSDFDTACWPEDFGAYGRAPSSIQHYSPGWCPEGYATPGQFQADGTTTAICCPSDFSYGSTYSSINFFGSSSVLFEGCLSDFSGTTKVAARDNSSMITVSGSDITMWAQPISVLYQARDLSLFDVTTTSADSTKTTSGGTISKTATLPANTIENPDAVQTSGGNGTSASSDNNTPEFTGLSTGATAGIAVGAALIGVGIIATLVFFIMRKRRNARRQPLSMGQSAYAAQDSKEPFRNQHGQQQGMWQRGELDAGPTSEYRPELDGRESTPGGGFTGRPMRAKQAPGVRSELE